MRRTMLLLLAGLTAALSGAWLVAPRLHRFAYWIDRKTDAFVDSLATDGWRADRLTTAEGIVLRGLVRPPLAGNARWILFVPGNSTDLLAGFRSELERLRGESDVGIALWAYRGFEASDGEPSPGALLDDLLCQWEHLQQLGAAREHIEVWGYSLGTPLATQLAARLSAAGTPPARLVLAAAAARIPVMRADMLGRFRSDDVYDATEAAAQVRCPVVIVHGVLDDVLPIAGAREFARRFAPAATLHEVPGKGHSDLWADLRRLAFR